MSKKHCLVVGVGAGTGAAVCRRFVQDGYHVSMIARSPERLADFAESIEGTTPYATDIVDIDAYRATLEQIARDHGTPDVVIYNATLATFSTLAELDYRKLERNFRANCSGLMVTAQTLGPAMIERGSGSLVVTGNTAALRGKPAFVGWSATKAAQRNMAECLARELGPQGVHVAYVVIDAVIDMPFARDRRPELPDEFFAKPSELADEIFHVAHQPRSAQSFLVELRPFGETW